MKNKTGISKKRLLKWKRYCTKCGAELEMRPNTYFGSSTGKKEIRNIKYNCPNKKSVFDGHDRYTDPDDLY